MAKKPQVKKPTEALKPVDVPKRTEAPKPTAKVEPKKETSVTVTNVSDSRFVQPSSGVTLWPGNTKPVTNDSWLKNQMDAGFLVKA